MGILLRAIAHLSPTRWDRPIQAHSLARKHREIQPSLPFGRASAGKDPVELRAVDRPPAASPRPRCSASTDGGADIVLIDRAHHQIVGDDDAPDNSTSCG